MQSQVRVRFAPSPTGYFHVGGARTALFNWLFARRHGGRFILRVEDTDRTRYDPDSLSDLMEGLRWLGWFWDEGPEVGGSYGPYFQSDRLELYNKYAEQLVADGLAYRCYCSSERLSALREQQHQAGQAPGYDRHCRWLTRQQIADYEAQGIRPVIRLAVPAEGTVEFDDALRGHIAVEHRQLDDLVLLKSDGFATYHLGMVVDDHLMEISHVLRGDEWLSSAPRHALLYKSFGWEMPVLVHLPTILDPSGHGKLSKRKKKTADGQEMLTYVHEFRQSGYLPETLTNFLALVGWSCDGETEFMSRDELVRCFDLDRISKSPAAFSYDKLNHMNATYIRSLGYNDLAGRLLGTYRASGTEVEISTVLKIVPLVRERIEVLEDVLELTDFLFRDGVECQAETLVQKGMDPTSTRQALEAAIEAIEDMPELNEQALEQTLRLVGDSLGLKPRQFFGCLRVATTGKEVAPPLFGCLEILGKGKVLRRLRAAADIL